MKKKKKVTSINTGYGVVVTSGVPAYVRKQIPEIVTNAKSFLSERYPKYNLENVRIIFGTGRRICYYRNKNRNLPPTVQLGYRNELWMYQKKTVGLTARGIKAGIKVSTESALVHELTHHIQHERGDKRISEVETTRNEVKFLREKYPEWYKRLTVFF
jgi:hypothetical protein